MDHYTNLAVRYDEYYRYSEAYIDYFTNKIIEDLEVKKCETVVEVGSGTGIFAEEILKKVPSITMICVDNSALMLNRNKNEQIEKICQDAVEFSKRHIVYNKVYMKEFIHHLSKEGRLHLFRGLYRQLRNNGCLLILLEPRRLNYPLFDEALRQFEIKQPSRLELITELEASGFVTSFSIISHQINVKKTKYIEMVRNRYISVLENFSDDEIENGTACINETQNDDIEFLEIFYNIKAVKSNSN